MDNKISYVDLMLMRSLRYNKHDKYLRGAKDLQEFKKAFLFIYYPQGNPDPSFVKTAKTVNFQAIYDFIKQI